MDNNKKICTLMFLMVLGTCNIVSAEQNSTPAQEPTIVQAPSEESEEVKGNKESFDKAVQCMDKKDYQSAIVYLTAYINSKPKKYEAYKLRGDAFYALRQYILAQNDYQIAIELKTDDDKFITGTKVIGAVVLGADKNEQLQNPELGNLYARLMYAQKALNNPAYETTYAKAFEYNSHIYLPKPKSIEIAQINCPQKYGKMLNPQGVDEYIYGAIDDIEKGHFSEAIYKTQYVTTNYPKYYLGHYLTGVALAGMEKDKDAITAFQTALKFNPYDFESLASLGQIYYNNAEKTFSVEDAKKSIDYFKQALKYNSNCYIYYYYIGLNELQMGNVDLAITNFNKAIKFKANDYNSLYYKLIAQYIKDDYNSVIEGCTKLLYKHVSNYNSVLYLRALAYYRLGQNDNAIADLEKIQNNVDDIYNADVRVVSNKEKTLDNYVYYLKAQILKSQGFGAKSDMMKALQNPIIAKLSKIEEAATLYSKDLNSDVISLNLYNRYNDFYESSLPKMLQSNLLITVDDIDNQYDYIRTTFDNLGITFNYKEPYYQMTNIEDYVYKKYFSKLSKDDQQTVLAKVSPELKGDILQEAQPALKATTSQSEMLAKSSQPSIAQMLAAQSLGAAAFQSVSNVSVDDFVKTVPNSAEIKSEVEKTKNTYQDENVKKLLAEEADYDKNIETTKSVDDNENISLAKGEPIIIVADKKASDVVEDEKTTSDNEVEQNKDIVEANTTVKTDDKVSEVKPQDENIIEVDKNDTLSDKEVITSPKEQEVSEIKTEKVKDAKEIKSNEEVVKEQVNNEPKEETQNQSKEDEIVNNDKKVEVLSEPVEAQKPENTIVEKHAQINPKDFDFVHKEAPEVAENADVVELQPRKFMGEYDKHVASKPFEMVDSNKSVQDNFEEAIQKEEKSLSKEQSAEIAKNVTVDDEKSAILIPENNVKEDKTVAVPVVMVPEMKSKNSETNISEDKKVVTKLADNVENNSQVPQLKEEKTLDDSAAQSENSTLSLRPQAQIDEKELASSKVKETDIVEDSTKKALSNDEKIKAKAIEQEAINRAKEMERLRKAAEEQTKQEEKLAAQKQKEEEKAAKEQAKQEEKLAAQKQKEEEKAAEEQTKQEEKLAAQKQKEEEKLAKEQAKQEAKLAAQKQKEEKAAAEQAKQDAKLAAQKQKEEEKAAKEQAKQEAELAAQKQKEEEKLAKEQAKQEAKLAAQKQKEEEKLAKEQDKQDEESKTESDLSKEDKENDVTQEDVLSSFVQSTFGSSDDDKAEREINEHKKVKSSEKSQDKLIENSKNKDTNKKSKIENKKLEELNSKKEDKETTVDTSNDNNEVSTSNKTELKEDEKSSKKEKFSFRNLFPWLRKSDSKSENSEVLENDSPTQVDNAENLNKKNVDKNKEEASLDSKNQTTEKEINNLDNQNTNVQSKTKRFSKASGDESVVYEKTANDKKIIKRLEK